MKYKANTILETNKNITNTSTTVEYYLVSLTLINGCNSSGDGGGNHIMKIL